MPHARTMLGFIGFMDIATLAVASMTGSPEAWVRLRPHAVALVNITIGIFGDRPVAYVV